MKVVIAIESDSDGGVMVTIHPSVEQLQADIAAGQGTRAHTYAAIAYNAMHAKALEEAAAGGYMESGPLPDKKH